MTTPSRRDLLSSMPGALLGLGLLPGLSGLPAGLGPRLAHDQGPGPAAWFNARSLGARGDGKADDTKALLDTIKAAQAAGPGSVVYAPAGTYLLSQTLVVDRHGITLHIEGTLAPFASFSGFLLKLDGRNTTAGRNNDRWQGKIDILKLSIDGKYQCHGLDIERIDHSLISNVLIERTLGSGLRMAVVRESDFLNVCLAGCNGGTEPNILVYQPDGDGTNNVRFYGLTCVYSAGQVLKIDSDTRSPSRNLFFYGAQFHYLDRDRPWGTPSNTVRLIELLDTDHICFIGGNLRLGIASGGTLITLGSAGKSAQNITFLAATLNGEGQGAVGIDLLNARDVSLVGSDLLMRNGTDIRGTADGLTQVDCDGVTQMPRRSAPRRAVVGRVVTADGNRWNPAGKSGSRPYPVFFDGNRWVAMG